VIILDNDGEFPPPHLPFDTLVRIMLLFPFAHRSGDIGYRQPVVLTVPLFRGSDISATAGGIEAGFHNLVS
jgi:hypothetical protein